MIVLSSCSYNERQKAIIEKVSRRESGIYSKSAKDSISIIFDKEELVELTDHPNPYVRIFFYNHLVEHYPDACFDICLNHMSDSATVHVQTSYDTSSDMTIAEEMIRLARNKKIFSSRKKYAMDSTIVVNVEKYPYLEDDFYLYLYKNASNPDLKFYKQVRKMISEGHGEVFGRFALLGYFRGYKIEQDAKLIRTYLEDTVESEDGVGYNFGIEFIENHPDADYYEILTNFYDKRIKNRVTRCDECYFELEFFCKALSQYKREETKLILNQILKSRNYKSLCHHGAINEHMYQLLTKCDKEYYDQIIKDLEHKIDHKILAEVRKYNE